jgi:hypothetical protein
MEQGAAYEKTPTATATSHNHTSLMARKNHRSDSTTRLTLATFSAHSIMMVNSAQPGEGGVPGNSLDTSCIAPLPPQQNSPSLLGNRRLQQSLQITTTISCWQVGTPVSEELQQHSQQTTTTLSCWPVGVVAFVKKCSNSNPKKL